MFILIGMSVLSFEACTTIEGKRKEQKASTKSSTSDLTVAFVESPTAAPSPFEDGSFIDDDHAWVTFIQLKRTNDGGRTWMEMRPTSADEPIFGKVQASYIRPYFITPQHGWLKAASGLWQTEDGGLTWRLLFPSGSEIPQFADAEHGWINVRVTDESEQSYITQNGGKTWQQCGNTRSYNTQHPGGRAYFLTQELGWAITSRTVDRQTIYGVAHTSDGGCSWKQIWTSNENPDEWYSDIYFLNEREGWLAGKANGSLYHTTDGGKSWEDLPLPTERTKVTDVYFIRSTEGWIIAKKIGGDTEGIFHTENGGETWRQMTRSEIVTPGEFPAKWKAGKLLQLLCASRGKSS